MSHPSNRTAARFLSLLVAVLCMAASAVGIRLSQKSAPFSLGDFSQVSLQEQLDAFQASQSNEDLVTLLKVLCWQAVEDDNQTAECRIRQ